MITASKIAKILNDSGLSINNARKEGLLPIGKNTACKILDNEGYVKDRTRKMWVLASDQSSEVVKAAPPSDLLPATTVFLADDELHALKQLAQQIINGNGFDIAVTQGNNNVQLYERTRALEKGTTTRKTYVVDEKIASRFDAIADRSNLDKSQLLTLALSDFVDKYDA